MENINTLDPQRYAVIDVDSGTVLGTNLRLVPIIPSVWEDVENEDSYAREYAERHGAHLHAVPQTDGLVTVTETVVTTYRVPLDQMEGDIVSHGYVTSEEVVTRDIDFV